MKKAFCFLLVLLIALTSVSALAFCEADKEIENVIFTQTTVRGDEKYAEGVSVKNDFFCGSNMTWSCETDFSFRENTTETDFTYHPMGYKENYDSDYYGLDFHVFSYPVLHYFKEELEFLSDGARRLYEDFMAQAEKNEGETFTFEVRLKDYFEYYPLSISLSVPGYNLNFSEEYAKNFIKPEDAEIAQKLSEFFKIPVESWDYTKITSDFSSSGGSWSSSAESNTFYFDNFSARAGNNIYYTFGNKNSEGKKVDTSLIPGGYGIYRLPFEETEMNKYGESARVLVDKLKMVYGIDEDSSVFALNSSFDKKQLYLLIKEKGIYYLDVIDIKTMVRTERFDLELDEGGPFIACVKDNFLVVLSDGGEESELQLFQKNEDGTHERKINITAPYVHGKDYAWNGERLALVTEVNKQNELHYEIQYFCNFTLRVFDKSGELYAGQLACSLDTGANSSGIGRYYVHPSWNTDKDIRVSIR